MVDSLYYLSFCMCTFFWIQCGNNASGTEQNYSKKVHLKQNRLYISSIPTQKGLIRRLAQCSVLK